MRITEEILIFDVEGFQVTSSGITLDSMLSRNFVDGRPLVVLAPRLGRSHYTLFGFTKNVAKNRNDAAHDEGCSTDELDGFHDAASVSRWLRLHFAQSLLDVS